jgi:hypothetical protein
MAAEGKAKPRWDFILSAQPASFGPGGKETTQGAGGGDGAF